MGPLAHSAATAAPLAPQCPTALGAAGLLRACQGDFFGEQPTRLTGVLAAKRNEHQAQSFHQAHPQDSLQPQSPRPCSCRAVRGPAATEGTGLFGAAC